MRRRTARMATALVAGVLALVLFPLAAPPTAAADPDGAPRAIQPFTLDMVEGGLRLRGAEEPYAIENPTRIAGNVDTGDDGTGAISGATFTTPRISFQQEITDPVVATVFIDADFAQVTPGSGAGSIDSEGNVLFQTALKVDLHIEVIGLVADCTSSPINLTLESTSPYNPETGRVTLAAPNFTVPPAPTGGQCSALIGDAINDQLAGPGHAISLTLEGAIELPPPPGCPTVAELTVTPEDGTRLGTTVTLGASVEADPAFADAEECADVPDHPAGFVDFRDGATVLGTVALADGEASLATASLPAGDRSLSVRYRGEPPFRASSTDPLSYRVAATPEIVSTLPEFLPIGVPTTFDVELDNNGLGFDVIDARLDVTLRRANGTAAFTSDRVLLEYNDGTAWQPIPLATPSARNLLGSVGPHFPLLPGENRVIPMRITLQPNPTPTPTMIPGPMGASFELIEVDPDTDLPAPALALAPGAVASTSAVVHMIEEPRRPTTLAFRTLNPLVLNQLSAPVVRQGYVVAIPGLNLSGPAAGQASGAIEVFIDGRRTPVRGATTNATTPLSEGYLERLPLVNGGVPNVIQFEVPDDIAPGEHQVQARYTGDAAHAPSVAAPTILTVQPNFLPLYECQAPLGPLSARFTAGIEAHANLPGYARVGGVVPLGQFDVTLRTDRGTPSSQLSGVFGTGSIPVGTGRLSGIRFGIGPVGQGTAAGLTRTGTQMGAPDLANVDQVVTFNGENGSFPIDGAPGEVVPVTLDSINLDFTEGTLQPASTFICTPVGDPVELGQITIAGTTLSVSPGTNVRVGDQVTLSATVAPAGVPGNMVFTDNGTTVGVVPVSPTGTASTTFTAVEGTRTLKARFFGGSGVLSSEDEKVIAVVATDCAPFAEPGNGAVVRLVYMELLRRCPDQAGFDHWKGRLDSGTSRQVFADTISRSFEARRVVANDGYQTMLGRNGDAAGLNFWAGYLATGRYDNLLAAMGNSGEYWNLAGQTNTGFVTRTYERVLLRAPDEAGLAHWVGRLNAGTSRLALLTTFTRLEEPARTIIRRSFQEILDRNPTGEEMTTQLGLYRPNGNRSALYGRLIGTQEFVDRAQTFPNFI